MKQRQHCLLRRWFQVDQQIPARNQMHFGERRILRDVVRREHNELPKILRDLITVGLLAEEPLAALFTDVFELLFGIKSRAGFAQGSRVDIRREDFHVMLAASIG